MDKNSPKPSRGESRRALVLKAAGEVFLEQGYDRTSLESIIRRSGGSRRTFYEQFGNKEGLFAAVVQDICDQILNRLSRLELGSGNPEEELIKAGKSFVEIITTPRILAFFRILLAEMARFPELGGLYYRSGPQAAHKIVADYLKTQATEGRLRIDSPERAAKQLIEMFKGDLHLRALLFPQARPTPKDIDLHVRFAVHTFLQGKIVEKAD